MTLRRTASGLASMHLFFQVDKVVYCEGGSALAIERVLAGDGSDTTHDILFWSRIVAWCGAKKKYHFKSVGGRSTIASIISDIKRLKIATVIACRDRDYDHHLGKAEDHENVAITHGYSWENDVVALEILVSLFLSLVPDDRRSREIAAKLNGGLQSAGNELVRCCEIDINLIARGKAGLFVRSNPLEMHDSRICIPRIKKHLVRGRLGALGYRRAPPRRIRLQDSDGWRHCCGKTIARLAYNATVNSAKLRDAKISLSYEMFMRLCIDATVQGMRLSGERSLETHFSKYRAIFD